MKKRIFSALLAVLMIFSTLSISVFADETHVHSDEEYSFSGASEFVTAVEVLNQKDTSDVVINLDCDITELPEAWVGLGSEEYPFSGTFNGKGNYVTEDAAKALFANIDATNAKISGFYIGTRPVEPECEHTNKVYTYNYNGTHNVSCKDCGESIGKNVKCTWTDCKACECGSECKHLDVTKWTLKNNGNNTHSYVCSCGYVVSTSKCTFGKITGKCIICGKGECKHSNENYTYESLDIIGHSVLCGDCGDTITAIEPHTDVTGKTACEKCGWKISDTAGNIENAVDATQQAFCHKYHSANLKYTSNGNNTHTVTCNEHKIGFGKFAVVVPITWTESCTFGDDGVCTGCKATKCNHIGKTYTYTNNNDGTHTVICKNCGEVANEAEKCTYTNGTCVCGAKCSHVKTKVHYESKVDNNGKCVHSLVCSCGYVYYTQPCKTICGSDKCIICGGKVNAPVTPEEPETEEHECDVDSHLSATTTVHYNYCKECGLVDGIEACVFNQDGDKCVCGNVKPTTTTPTLVPVKVHFVDETDNHAVRIATARVSKDATSVSVDSVKDKAPSGYEIVTEGNVDIVNGVVTIIIRKVETPDPDEDKDSETKPDGDKNPDGDNTTPDTKPSVDKSTVKLNLDIASLRRQVFTIKGEKTEGGKVTNFGKTGKTTVKWGCSSKTFTFTPDDGYVVADVIVDGVSIGAVEKYTFKKVTENHTIKVIFEEAE